jgi:hypothetical protein
MNAGDTIRIHLFVNSASQGWNISVTDVTTNQSGMIVLNSKYGPISAPHKAPVPPAVITAASQEVPVITAADGYLPPGRDAAHAYATRTLVIATSQTGGSST